MTSERIASGLCSIELSTALASKCGVSRMTTLGATSGDQCAGCNMGDWSAPQGKAQAPSPGKALPFSCLLGGAGCDVGCRSDKVALVVRISAQKFLRQIRTVMGLEFTGGFMRTPVRNSAHGLAPTCVYSGRSLSLPAIDFLLNSRNLREALLGSAQIMRCGYHYITEIYKKKSGLTGQ